jgi:cellulose synthase/poly-beta-1,6-N-acetylglucosamine synthase-like glycosyltransferase
MARSFLIGISAPPSATKAVHKWNNADEKGKMTHYSEIILLAIAGTVVVLTLPGTIELIVVTLGGLLPQPRPKIKVKPHTGTMAVIVPAHNEASEIFACVASLKKACANDQASQIVVVADNCTDETAFLAYLSGARVIERCEPTKRGKGFALDFAFRHLQEEGVELFAVVDADTAVDANFTAVLRQHFGAGAQAVQTRYQVKNPEASLRTRLLNIANMAFNVLRPRGRQRWDLSVGLLGNGFALTRETLQAVPYSASSVVEDAEYHLLMLEAGLRVTFANGTIVRGAMPVQGKGVTTQRARWEGGRLRLLRQAAPRLARRLFRGDWRLWEPLCDLLLLPLAFHALILLAALLLPFAAVRLYAVAGLSLLLLHVLAAVRVGGGSWRDLFILATVPFYMAWKVAIVPLLFKTSSSRAVWVRTQRLAETSS